MTDEANPLELIFDEIRRALNAGLPYLAIACSLTVPDICAALESPDGKTHSHRYKKWFNEHLQSKFTHMSADHCYQLRCGIVHQGKIHTLFMVRSANEAPFHQNVGLGVIQYDSWVFCEDIIEAARRWYTLKKNDPLVTKNFADVVRFRPEGLPPHFVGFPLIG